MGWIMILIVGALIGWIASLIMRLDNELGVVANVFIGIVGAALGRWLFADVLGLASANVAGELSLAGLFWGVLGALVFIGALKMIRIEPQ